MKPIIVTEGNLQYIYGRVRKFFYNRNRTGFSKWSSFDCGFKKNLRSFSKNGMDFISPKFVKIDSHKDIPGISDKPFILIKLVPNAEFAIRIGNRVAFCGNRIIVQNNHCYPFEHNFEYEVFQVLPVEELRAKEHDVEQIKPMTILKDVLMREEWVHDSRSRFLNDDAIYHSESY